MNFERALIVSECYAGLQAQALGLAERAGLGTTLKVLAPRFPWRHLPARLWPNPLQAADFGAMPQGDLIIGCGGVAGAVGSRLKRRGLRVVQVQNPRLPARLFDLVVANAHDELTGPNVLVTRTALHRVTPQKLRDARALWGPKLLHLKRPLVAVLVGGSNGRFRFGEGEALALALKLGTMMKRDKVGLAITPSRRTGAAQLAILQRILAPLGAYIWDMQGENPYFGLLALADAIVVTLDSISMVSEAVSTKAPVLVETLPGRSRRIGLFAAMLEQERRVRPFAAQLESWEVEPMDDTGWAAAEMLRRLEGLGVMLDIQTFDARSGGNVLYKALAHPLAAERAQQLFAQLRALGPVAVFDPDNVASALVAMHPGAPAIETILVQDVRDIGAIRAGLPARPLSEIGEITERALLIACFDAARIKARLQPFLPAAVQLFDLDFLRIPLSMLSVPGRYLDRLNFATNYAFFREQDGLSTRLVTANYWAGYGARAVRLWLRLYDEQGAAIAEWEQPMPPGAGGLTIDSAEIRQRFALPAFTGQLFIHAIGAAGHDVVKYALDTYASGNNASGNNGSLSCTHDANAWPSERYAGMPAPDADETVILWVQNSHAAPIPAGAIALDRMGAERPVAWPAEIPPYASLALDVATLLPGLRWPAQIELRSGRHIVRPRYEVLRAGRTRIAHMNVERADLPPDPGIKSLPAPLGRGFVLPFPLLPADRFRSIVLPTPMAHAQHSLPLRLDVFDSQGVQRGARFLGNLPRDHAVAVDLAEFGVASGHGELLYDFAQGGDADGWLHALVRYEDRNSGHVAESSFGAHIYNTLMTYRDEPQSYAGPPPGLTTRLFLKLGDGARRSFTCLIYPVSGPWRARSSTQFLLFDAAGQQIAQQDLAINAAGSALVFPDELFGAGLVAQAGVGGYVLIRDQTCRLFGYHGLMDQKGGFSLDHMFGF